MYCTTKSLSAPGLSTLHCSQSHQGQRGLRRSQVTSPGFQLPRPELPLPSPFHLFPAVPSLQVSKGTTSQWPWSQRGRPTAGGHRTDPVTWLTPAGSRRVPAYALSCGPSLALGGTSTPELSSFREHRRSAKPDSPEANSWMTASGTASAPTVMPIAAQGLDVSRCPDPHLHLH